MIITTWNVNGLRAAIKKDLIGWAQAQPPDVLCLQEIKSRPEQLEKDHLQQLQAIYPYITWHPAARPGYSGVVTLSRSQPVETQLGLGLPEFDVEGRLIMTRFPAFLLFNIYFPNGQHDLGRVPYKLDFYARLLELCDRLHARGEQVVLCGDFNTAHRPIDLKNAKANEGATGFLPEERAWIDYYLEHGFVDIYRHLYPDRIQYTWWTFITKARQRNVGWRLDYFLVSKSFVGCIADSVIHDSVPGSDHCPVSLVLRDLSGNEPCS